MRHEHEISRLRQELLPERDRRPSEERTVPRFPCDLEARPREELSGDGHRRHGRLDRLQRVPSSEHEDRRLLLLGGVRVRLHGPAPHQGGCLPGQEEGGRNREEGCRPHLPQPDRLALALLLPEGRRKGISQHRGDSVGIPGRDGPCACGPRALPRASGAGHPSPLHDGRVLTS